MTPLAVFLIRFQADYKQPTVILEIKQITAEETLPLRSSVLWPGAVQFVNVVGDDSSYHFGAFTLSNKNEPVSVISLFLDDLPDGTPVDTLPRPVMSGDSARFPEVCHSPRLPIKGCRNSTASLCFRFRSNGAEMSADMVLSAHLKPCLVPETWSGTHRRVMDESWSRICKNGQELLNSWVVRIVHAVCTASIYHNNPFYSQISHYLPH